ncbi:50S ribosome-binding GTPase [Agrococcus versicolor]|uniref:50S ribosome-binding GTPase n=1 Tax=Agrococcus versicolor TaxID=501482 RepID=A0ABP5MCP0_9MICO
MSLDASLDALEDAAELGVGRIDDADVDAIRAVLAGAASRRALSSEHTVVGLFGATGSGKSSLLNAVVGQELARAHVRRPTTSEPLAAVWGAEGSDALLDWLQVTDRRHVDEPFAGDASLSLILLDLPDFDSVAPEHRAIAERLAGQVDVLVWVVDPQKYADAVLHHAFVAPLRSHGAVTAAVLNQVDLLPAGAVPDVVASLRGLLAADGLADVRVLPASATTGEGIEAVRAVVARFARDRAARSARLAADVASAAARLDAPAIAPEVPAADRERLVDGLCAAARVDVVAQATGASYRKRAGQATGWILTAWLLRLRPDPLRRLHLLPQRRPRDRDADLHRTALPTPSSAERAQASLAVRGYADAAAAGLGDGWRAAVLQAANDALAIVPDALDRAVARTDLGARGSWWWIVLAIVQWIALGTALVGVGWLLAAALLPLWGLPGPEVPLEQGWPVPTLLIAAGVLLGILVGLLGAGLGGAIGAARRGRARRRLRRAVAEVARVDVVEPIVLERDRAVMFADAVRRVRG